MDAVRFSTREVIELKPMNPRAIARGSRQVQRYVEELNGLIDDDRPWTGHVWRY